MSSSFLHFIKKTCLFNKNAESIMAFIKKPNSLFHPSVIIIVFKYNCIDKVNYPHTFVAMICDCSHY